MRSLRIGAALVVVLLAVATTVAQTKRPNVLIILTDDQGLGDFSAHGNPILKTPNLDALRAESVRFTDFHSAPMCTPTRGQLMTGVDAVRNGATSVTGGRSFLRPGIPTMPEMFAAAGYRTGIFGKWHLGDHYPHRPTDKGFRTAVWHMGWGFTAAPEFTNTLFDGRYIEGVETKRFQGHVTDFWFARATAWMRERKTKGEPFLCYLATNAPHAPHVVAEKYSAPYQGQGPAEFFGMIAQIDENIGRLDKFLKESELRDNTIVIFMTDNGGTAGVKTFNAGLRAQKTTYYEGGHLVPFWVRWPAGKLTRPRDIATPAQVQDVLPTLLELTGVKPSAQARFDGQSLAGLLRGTSELSERAFVVQYSRAKLEKWQSCVVWQQWRLVEGKELYDVVADRAQTQDLAAKQPEVLARLRAHYEAWWAGLGDKVNEFVPISLGARQQPTVALTSADWQDVYADNSNHIRNAEGGPRGGHWNVQVERAGEYEFKLRRWPPELALPLTASAPAHRSGDNRVIPGKALPIAGAKLTIAGQELSAASKPEDQAIMLRAKLPAGRTQLHAWFVDAAAQDVSGAYYVEVSPRRK